MKEIKISVDDQQELLDEKERLTEELSRLEKVLTAMLVLEQYKEDQANKSSA